MPIVPTALITVCELRDCPTTVSCPPCMQEALKLHLSHEETVAHVHRSIQASCDAMTSYMYDSYQYYVNSIV